MTPVVDEQLLDDTTALEHGDPTGVLRAMAGAGAGVRRVLAHAGAAEVARGLARLAEEGRPRSVVVGSLGGSALVADVVALYAGAGGSAVPVTVRHGPPLPGWVGSLDLVVAVSQSGRAPGPLALATEAARRGCRLLTVGAGDSPLEAVAVQARGLHLHVDASAPTSRAAAWALVAAAVTGVGWALGDGAGALAAQLDAVADVLDAQAAACGPAVPTWENPAKSLALELAGDVPVFLGDGDVTGVAAVRAAAVLSRTARVPAVSGSLPDHAGEVVATFSGPFVGAADDAADVFSDPFLDGPPTPRLRLVMLRDAPGTLDRAAEQLADAVAAAADTAGVRASRLDAVPGGPLTRLASLVARTDLAATYLALGQSIDPGASAALPTLDASAGSGRGRPADV